MSRLRAEVVVASPERQVPRQAAVRELALSVLRVEPVQAALHVFDCLEQPAEEYAKALKQ